jgi:ADP-ribose pyrophosphatase
VEGAIVWNAGFPRIVSRTRTRISAWVDLVAKEVQFGPGNSPEQYHCLAQDAYVGVLARTTDGLIPIVRQYRPCVEQYTWELPAGTLDNGEVPENAARRELLEETGFEAGELIYLGNFHPDTGRLQVDSHAFYAVIRQPASALLAESGMTARLVDHRELRRMIVEGEFRHQLHLAIYAAVLARGFVLD